MDGYELAEEIRKRHGARAPTLFALSGYGQTRDKQRSGASGFALHMVKPIEPDMLLSAVRSVGAAGELAK
jgi:CheY-like chemotaxis protein